VAEGEAEIGTKDGKGMPKWLGGACPPLFEADYLVKCAATAGCTRGQKQKQAMKQGNAPPLSTQATNQHYSLYIGHRLEKSRRKRWRGKAMDDRRTKGENILPLCERGGETEGLCVLKKGRFERDEAMRKWPKKENGTMKKGREGILEGKRRR
jgi:hypothetical protein